MTPFVVLILGALALTGCASMAKYQADTAKYQALADQATAAFGAGSVTVIVNSGTQGRYIRLERKIELGVDGNPRYLLAHEISHHILGHVNAYLEQEEAANANAVKVLMVWGMSEEDAFRLVANTLLNVQKRGSLLTGKGHDWCRELRDLVSRYPQYPPKNPANVEATCPSTR